MFIRMEGHTKSAGQVVKATCPACGRDATFERVPVDDLFVPQGGLIIGQRRCPNDKCHCHLFFVAQGARLIATFPAERLDFDTTNIPDKIVFSLAEAITCHAERCYTAAAMMIRRTLEELCAVKGASGDNLKTKIRVLKEKVVIPQELFDGMDDLRLLGNDAAHIESHAFENVGKDEVEVGIEFSKEILKAVYQYSSLLKRLRSLKKPQDKQSGDSTASA